MKIGDPEMNWIGSDEYKHRVLKKKPQFNLSYYQKFTDVKNPRY